jgi:hypothetical protein
VRGHATVEGGIACVFYGPDVPAGTSPNVRIAVGIANNLTAEKTLAADALPRM